MANTQLLLTGHPSDFPVAPTNDPRRQLIEIANYLEACAGGMKTATGLQLLGTAVAATATVTCANVNAADTVTVGNTVFTAVNGGTPTNVQFDMSGDATAEGVALAAAINNHTTVSRYVTASAAAGVVTLTAKVPGVIGNALQVSSSNGTRLAVVAFANGSNDATKTYTLGG